jgi:hypothetical protein
MAKWAQEDVKTSYNLLNNNNNNNKLDAKHWYEHVPKSVETSRGGKVTIL